MGSFIKQVFSGVAVRIVLWLLALLGASTFPILLKSGVLTSPPLMLAAAFVSGGTLGIVVCFSFLSWISRKTGHLVIEKAYWGTDEFHRLDMTQRIRGTVCDDKLLVHHVTNSHMEVEDPHFGEQKTLTIFYSFTGLWRKKEFKESHQNAAKLP